MTFGATPVADLVSDHIPIMVFQKGREYDLLAASHLEGFYVHFDGRSRICAGEPLCRLCGTGRPRRYLGFFAAMFERDRVLVRVTAEAAMRLISHPVAPGKVYRATSVGSRRPLQIAQIGTAKLPEAQILERKELLRVLAAIHGLGVLPGNLDYKASLNEARERAKKLIDRECFA